MKLGLELCNVSRDFGSTGLGETRPAGGYLGRLAGAWRAVLLALLTVVWTGCGYGTAYGPGSARYEVVAGRASTASFEAIQVAVGGVRSELGAAEALGQGFPQVVVEVLRVDERSIGVRSTGNAQPLARGTEIVVVGRAQVLDAAGAEPSLDTGDMSRASQYAAGATPTADAAARSRAVRDAARSLGKALGRAVLGLPEPAEG